MKENSLAKGFAILVSGFILGAGTSNLPIASAKTGTKDLAQRQFTVSIDEIRQNFVFGDLFVGSYSKTLTLSDGTKRTVKLTPIIRKGMQVVELDDTGGTTYMSLNGTTTNGKLMIQLHDIETLKAQAEADGWTTKP